MVKYYISQYYWQEEAMWISCVFTDDGTNVEFYQRLSCGCTCQDSLRRGVHNLIDGIIIPMDFDKGDAAKLRLKQTINLPNWFVEEFQIK